MSLFHSLGGISVAYFHFLRADSILSGFHCLYSWLPGYQQVVYLRPFWDPKTYFSPLLAVKLTLLRKLCNVRWLCGFFLIDQECLLLWKVHMSSANVYFFNIDKRTKASLINENNILSWHDCNIDYRGLWCRYLFSVIWSNPITLPASHESDLNKTENTISIFTWLCWGAL